MSKIDIYLKYKDLFARADKLVRAFKGAELIRNGRKNIKDADWGLIISSDPASEMLQYYLAIAINHHKDILLSSALEYFRLRVEDDRKAAEDEACDVLKMTARRDG